MAQLAAAGTFSNYGSKAHETNHQTAGGAAALLAMYADAKTGLSQDLKLEALARKAAREVRRRGEY